MSMSILKAMAGVTAGFSLLVFFVLLRDGFMEALVVLGKFLLFGLAGTLLLFGISYAIFALMNSGRYYVLFEMDGTGVNHIQIGKQVKKEKALGLLTSLAGVSARSISITGTGLIAGSKLSFYSDFGKVKRIVPMKKHDCIKLSGAFMKNQIYVTPEQFDFVWGYIISHTHISGGRFC